MTAIAPGGFTSVAGTPGTVVPMLDQVREALRSASSVRFLCTGNMVRSAFAELYARHLGCPLPVDSGATVYRNDGLFPQTQRALRGRGVGEDLLAAFRSRHIEDVPLDRESGRVVFGMVEEHLLEYRLRFGAGQPAFLLAQLIGTAEPIADPVLDGAPFDAVFDTVARCVEALVATLIEAQR